MITPDPDDAIRPVETIAALVCMTVVFLFCIGWLGNYVTGRGFISSCVDDGGVVVISDAGKECVHHSPHRE